MLLDAESPLLLVRSGQVSVQRAIIQVRQYKSKYAEGVAAYVEEAVVRRELSDNFCFYNEHYDQFQGEYCSTVRWVLPESTVLPVQTDTSNESTLMVTRRVSTEFAPFLSLKCARFDLERKLKRERVVSTGSVVSSFCSNSCRFRISEQQSNLDCPNYCLRRFSDSDQVKL